MKKGRGTLSVIEKISMFCTSRGQYKPSNFEREKDILHHLRPDQTIREHVFIQLSNNVLGTNVAVWKRERRTFQIILGLTRQSRLALGRSQACCCCSNLFLWNMSTAGVHPNVSTAGWTCLTKCPFKYEQLEKLEDILQNYFALHSIKYIHSTHAHLVTHICQ